ncbi:hypothetical protein C4559_05280 [Candidatus Microgenomates bacterium]|nr:MAG: hypothetical protein C4559_05280 [Candidatus Microgenomates bacterium]
MTIEDFKKLEIRIGRVVSAQKVENADKLLKLEVDFGPAKQDSEDESAKETPPRWPAESQDSSDGGGICANENNSRIIRQILSGIAQFYNPEDLIGKEFPFVVNLEPRIIRGLESQGMILAVNEGGKAVLLSPEKDVQEGSAIG